MKYANILKEKESETVLAEASKVTGMSWKKAGFIGAGVLAVGGLVSMLHKKESGVES